MSVTRPKFSRRSRLRALVSVVGVAALGALPTGALADAGTVQLTSVFASPVVASPFGLADDAAKTKNEQILCNPEPAGQQIYGTQNDVVQADGTSLYDPSVNNSSNAIGKGYPAYADQPASTTPAYKAANFPSNAQLTPALQAGASNDLCFGFTLTPDVQTTAAFTGDKGLIRSATNTVGKRLQNAVPVPDVDATNVALTSTGDPVDNDDMKNLSIEMPAGFLGDPDSGPQCSAADFGATTFDATKCAAGTQVGTTYVRVTGIVQPGAHPLLVHLVNGGSTNVSGGFQGGQVFNLQHGPNELGLLGVAIQPVDGVAPAKFLVRLQLDPDGSGRVQTVVTDAPRRLYSPQYASDGVTVTSYVPTPMYVESIGLRAWGSKADHPQLSTDFAQWGTDCTTPLDATVSMETYLGNKSQMTSKPFTMTGCDQLPFLPSVSVTTAEHAPATPTAATVTVSLGQTTSGPRSALLKDASVTLPQGLEIGAQVGARDGGLNLCTADQFGVGNTTASACPAGSIAGDLTINSPLQSRPFLGHVYLGPQTATGELPQLYLEATPSGADAADAPRIKLVGTVTADADGRVTTVIKDAPQLRFTTLQIQFTGGQNALFSTPRACGTTTAQSTFTSSASATPVTVDDTPLVIDQNCDTPAFAPSFAMTPTDTTVGSRAPTTIAISREDRSPWLSGITVALPSGFLADLNAATECSAADAAAGTCSDASRMGTVTTQAGVGANPLTLTGAIYLVAPQAGAVAGAVIVVPAKIGDIDLGNVVVPATINLRPTDAGLTLTTTTPTRFKNLALNLRSVVVSLDRANFPLNPTACGPLAASGSFTGDAGQTSSASTSVTYTGCAARPLQPVLSASLTGDTKPFGHPQVNVNITTRPGDSNLKSTTVTLPAGVSSDLKNLQSTCAPEAFDAGNCPAANRVGSAAAHVSITSDTISGDVYLVKVPGQALPGLGLSFTGRYTQRLLSTIKIGPGSRLVAQFNAIPDLPLTSLNLVLDGGTKGPVQMGAACTADSSWDVVFGGQGGQSASQAIPYPCKTIPVPAPSVKWSRKTGIKFTVTPPAKSTIKSTKLTLPSGFTFKTTKSGKKNLKVTLTGGKGKVKFTKSGFSVAASGAGPVKITVTLKPKGYSISKKAAKSFKKGKKLKLKLRVGASNGQVLSKTTSVKIS